MSLTEVKEQIQRMSLEERAEVEKLLRMMRVVENPEYRSKVEQAEAEMNAGLKVTRAQLEAELAKRRAAAT